LHQDGNPHIHVYLEFPKTQSIYSRTTLNLDIHDEEPIVREESYEATKYKNKTLEYLYTYAKTVGYSYLTNIILPIIDVGLYTKTEGH